MEPNKFKSIVDDLTVLTVRNSNNTNRNAKFRLEDNLIPKCKPHQGQCHRCDQPVVNQVITISKERRTTVYATWMEKCNICKQKWNLPIKITNNSTRQDEIKSL